MGGRALWAPMGSCVAWRRCPTQPDLSCPEPAQKLGRPPREGASSLRRPERRGADFPESRGGNHGAFDEALAPLMAPRKGQAGCPGGAPRTWGVSHPRSPAETPATPAAGLGGSGARTPRAARTRAAPSANKRRGEEGGGFPVLPSRSIIHDHAARRRQGEFVQLSANNRRSGYDSFTPRNSAFPGAQERRSLCSSDKDLDARLPRASRTSGLPAPLCRFRGCWVRDTSADPDLVRLGPQTVPLSLPEPLQNPGKKYLARPKQGHPRCLGGCASSRTVGKGEPIYFIKVFQTLTDWYLTVSPAPLRNSGHAARG